MTLCESICVEYFLLRAMGSSMHFKMSFRYISSNWLKTKGQVNESTEFGWKLKIRHTQKILII